MKIEYKKLYINKTLRFLSPSLKGYGNEFIREINSVFFLAMGIHDTLLDGSTISNDRNIYILIDRKFVEYNFMIFMEYLRKHKGFKGDYCFGSNINSRKHMIIIKIPEMFNNAYDKFLQSKYSEMYDKEDIKFLFKNTNKDFHIVTKSNEGFENFKNTIYEEFDVKINLKNFENVEYELPLKKKEEIFNYPNGEGVFFSEDKDKKWFVEK